MIKFFLIILSTICNVYSQDWTKATPGEFKYFVTIWHKEEYHCGGTIIDQRHIVTRAFCVSGTSSSDLSVIAGTLDTFALNRKVFLVESIHIHYGVHTKVDPIVLDRIYWIHDIAVLKLLNEMIWDSLLAPIRLMTADDDWSSEDECIMPGWRSIHHKRDTPKLYIRWIQAKILPDKRCILSGIHLFKNEQCAFWRAPTHTAPSYSSGSPIVCGDFFMGISDGRKNGRYSTFLKLYPYLDFIVNAIDDKKTDVKPGEAPYVVSIWNQGSFKCGGIILDASRILTTGNCVRHASQTDLQVIAGHTQVIKKNHQIQWLSVYNIEIHPGYDEMMKLEGPKTMQIKNNYAILTLTTPLVWGPTIGRATLSNTDFKAMGPQICKAFLWHNAYTVDDEVLLQLVWSQESILHGHDCQGIEIDPGADEFCVHSRYVQRPTNVDSSGNPVVCGEFVIGIIVPNFFENPQPNLKSVLNIGSIRSLLDDVCY